MSPAYGADMPAVRLAGDCPKCGAPIAVRKRRSDNERFVACTAYPECKWACDYDEVLDELDATINRLQEEIQRLRDARQPFDPSRELRALIALAHPDKWPSAPTQAHEMTVRLNLLKEKLA